MLEMVAGERVALTSYLRWQRRNLIRLHRGPMKSLGMDPPTRTWPVSPRLNRILPCPRRVSMNSTIRTCSSVKATADQFGVLPVSIGSPTEPTTAVRWADACGRWTTFAPGELFCFPQQCVQVFHGSLLMFCRKSRVGGIISETSFKFFLQFVSYAAAFWMFIVIVMAVLVSEKRREVCSSHGHLDVSDPPKADGSKGSRADTCSSRSHNRSTSIGS